MSERPVRIAVLGASGRMGRAIVSRIPMERDVELCGATAAPASASLGKDAGLLAGTGPTVVTLVSDAARAIESADVAIDVALPSATAGNAAACVAASVPVVIGATGHDREAATAIDAAARRIAVLVAPNMSLGITLLLELAAHAGRVLGEEYDVEIHEAHHRHKKDAPSGTALAIGQAVAAARGVRLENVAVYSRHGADAQREPGAIGFAVTRAGDIVGDHLLTFAGPGERLELGHRASDRAAFARGAIAAARWLAGQRPGRYSMREVLGF